MRWINEMFKKLINQLGRELKETLVRSLLGQEQRHKNFCFFFQETGLVVLIQPHVMGSLDNPPSALVGIIDTR